MSTLLDDYVKFRNRLASFGSFFGPNPTYIPQRVLQEVGTWTQLPKLTLATRSSSSQKQNPPKQAPPEEAPAKKKADLIRNSRDYSSLLGDDSPAPPSKSPETSAKPPLPPKKKPAPANSKPSDYSFLTTAAPKPSPVTKTIGALAHLRKEEDVVPRKQSIDVKRKRVRALEEDDEPRPRKRAAVVRRRDDGDDDEALKARMMIRKMFGYNPDKYRDDDRDDRSMVAGFHDIQKEENRSAKIGRKTDAEELRKNEEEKRERLKKKKQQQAVH